MIVLQVVRMMNLHVMTALAYPDHGNVMYIIVTVLAVKMKLAVVATNV
jgi:metal-dependent HD superfamily phosphatase/phosphodiesterase